MVKPVALTQFPRSGTIAVTQGYGGDTSHSLVNTWSVDFRVTETTPVQVLSVLGGTVVGIRTGSSNGDTGAGSYGNFVTILHTGGFYATYAHLASDTVSVGQMVSSGTVIGIAGNTGFSTGIHIHVHFGTGTSGTIRGVTGATTSGTGDVIRANGSADLVPPAFFAGFFGPTEVGTFSGSAILNNDIFGTAGDDGPIGKADNFHGTDVDNRMFGGAGNDRLDGRGGNDILVGGTGADIMLGGAGNDTYYVDNVGDMVTELAGAGTDTVNSSINYALTANVENLNLTGTANINGTGNTLSNTLNGNLGNNIMDGGLDSVIDTLRGGGGNDTYIVRVGDVVIELAGAGTDTVNSGINYALTANVENLNLTGTANINGTGNTLSNTLNGNSGVNVLSGGGGNDTLNGGSGNDILIGGTGKDTLDGGTGSDRYVFAPLDSGQATGNIDLVYYVKGAVGVGDLIDYSLGLRIGGSAMAATGTQASINARTGVATFAASSGTNLTDALNDIATRFTAASNSPGEFALFKVGNTGNFHLFISDGNGGVGPGDVVVELIGVTSIGSINYLSSGDLSIMT